jgi:hypothetical protein
MLLSPEVFGARNLLQKIEMQPFAVPIMRATNITATALQKQVVSEGRPRWRGKSNRRQIWQWVADCHTLRAMTNRFQLPLVVIASALLLIAIDFYGVRTALSAGFSQVLARTQPAAANVVSPEQVILYAENHSTKDPAWAKRYYYGNRTWGVRGSGSVESGTISFDAFPGASGNYQIELSAIFEQDGSPPLRLLAGGVELFSGNLPYLNGHLDCSARGAARVLPLGVHHIEKGSRIDLWAQSVYQCGEKGAYMLWDALIFTPR